MSVTILCPNGRRQTIKVTPNTTISEILESICEKQSLDANEYDLFRNNKPLDPSLTIRFANIPNNGQIDLKAVPTKKSDQKVTLAIDLSTDEIERKIGDFDPNQNLWQIIHHLFDGNPNFNLNHNTEFCIVYMRKEICGETQLKTTSLKSLGLTRGKAALKLMIRPVDAVKEQAFVESLNLKKSFAKPSIETQEVVKNVPLNESVDQPIESIATEIETNKELSEPSGTDGTEIRFQQSSNKTHFTEKPKTEIENTFFEVKQTSAEIEQMEVESEESSEEEEEVVNYLDANQSQVFFKMSDLSKISRHDFPDEFYDVTKDDLMHVIQGLRQQQVGNFDKPLETKQMKENQRREQMTRYKTTVIRVCFPNDKLVFQALFKPTDTVQHMMQVVSGFVDVHDFYLYTVPPKRHLNPESTLFESDLVPAALIHFGLKSSASAQNVIKEEFKSKLTSYKSAAKIAANARKDVVKRVSDSSGTSSTIATNQTMNSRTGESSSGEKGKKIPKWLKTNK